MSTIRTLALQSPQIIIGATQAAFERRTGHRIEQLLRHDEMPVHARRKLDAGEGFDAAFVLPALMDELVREGRVAPASRTGFLRVPIGVAVCAGAPWPAIDTVEAFKQAMVAARSVAFLKAGISGPHLDQLFARFGIAEAIAAKSHRTETDTVGELVAAGEAEIGVTAIATLMATPGLDIVGPIPAEIQAHVVFEAALSTTTQIPDAAAALIAFVTGPEALPAIRAKGMLPW
ncbi:MAG: ABC transporter substrate-binding protein [Alphaproteobacteria bacterium]|nr:ABC transporter substrate-binding protein [Alphaproteobacteria bacterium]